MRLIIGLELSAARPSTRACASSCARASSSTCASSRTGALCGTLSLWWATAPRSEEDVHGVGQCFVTLAYVNTARGPVVPAEPGSPHSSSLHLPPQ